MFYFNIKIMFIEFCTTLCISIVNILLLYKSIYKFYIKTTKLMYCYFTNIINLKTLFVLINIWNYITDFDELLGYSSSKSVLII